MQSLSPGSLCLFIRLGLGEEAKPEDILKVMETLGGVALKVALEEKLSGPFGFNKKKDETEETP